MNNDAVHILLVEDEAAHAELVERAFEMSGKDAQLSVVRSLAEARAYLERNPVSPALIIADWRLPDGEGLELLTADPGPHAVPIVIMTSHGNASTGGPTGSEIHLDPREHLLSLRIVTRGFIEQVIGVSTNHGHFQDAIGLDVRIAPFSFGHPVRVPD